MHWGAEMSYSINAEGVNLPFGAEDAAALRELPVSAPVRLNEVAAAAANPGRSILALEGITLSFGGVAAITYVDLAVAPGEIHAIIGPNGAGKSSLINVAESTPRIAAG
jgi:branched-chain amino acid transport system ATP-binding protein